MGGARSHGEVKTKALGAGSWTRIGARSGELDAWVYEGKVVDVSIQEADPGEALPHP